MRSTFILSLFILHTMLALGQNNNIRFEMLEEFKLVEIDSNKKSVYDNGKGVSVSITIGKEIEDHANVPAIAALSMAALSEVVYGFEINYEEKIRDINGYPFTIFIYSYQPENASEREVTTSYFTSYNKKLIHIAFTCSRSQFDEWNEEFGNMISTIKFE